MGKTLTSPPSKSHLLALPWRSWASRLHGGAMTLRGRLVQQVEIDAATLGAGPIEIRLQFGGGIPPVMVRADVRARGVMAPVRPAEVEDLLAHLWDLHIDVAGRAATDLTLELPGMRVCIPRGAGVFAEGAAIGPPDALVLAGPLCLSSGDARLQLNGGHRLRWLSSLAEVRLERAVLHPDGRVALEGGARRGLDRAVRTGLLHAGQQLSALVQNSPRFGRIRSFLPR